MFDRIFKKALADAGIDEAAFLAAIKKAKFKSSFDWFMRGAPESLVDAYNNRIRMDAGNA